MPRNGQDEMRITAGLKFTVDDERILYYYFCIRNYVLCTMEGL
jgi:hypothetical protein